MIIFLLNGLFQMSSLINQSIDLTQSKLILQKNIYYFCSNWQVILNILWKCRGPGKAQMTFKEKKKVGTHVLPDSEIYSKHTLSHWYGIGVSIEI